MFFETREMTSELSRLITDGMAGSDKRSLRGIAYQIEIFEIP